MALKAAPHLPQGKELFHGEEAPFRQGGVEGGGGVALGEDEAVPIGVAGVLGVNPHYSQEKGGEDFHAGEGAPGVAAPSLANHGDNMAAKPFGYGFQLLNLERLACPAPDSLLRDSLA